MVKPLIEIRCQTCSSIFKVLPYLSSRKFCSKKCSNTVPHRYWLGKKRSADTKNKISQKKLGTVPWNKGVKGWNPHPAKPWLGVFGQDNPTWKGQKVGYRRLHNWVEEELGAPMVCSNCSFMSNNRRRIHWANKSHFYKRDTTDWIRLCVKCHIAYDKGKLILN